MSPQATSPVEICRLTTANAAALQRVAPDVFDQEIDPASLASFLADARHIMFLAVDQGLVVGMASGVEYFHPDKAPQMWINEVGVSPAYRRQGIGRRLTLALVDAARARGCVFVWLGTAHDNVDGQACFSSVPGVAAAQPFLLYEWDLED